VTKFKVGDRVVKNPAAWEANEFDAWGRGVGVGEVVEPPFELEPDLVDVRWPQGRCFESVGQLLLAPRQDRPPDCSLCQKPITGRVFYQGGQYSHPCHKNCRVVIRRGADGGI
jgi:hypothetical protein